MDALIKRFCPRLDFISYEDFKENFQITVPDNFNFAYDVVDEWARLEPKKKALVWCDDVDERHFTFTDISRLSNQAAQAFVRLGIGKGDVVMAMLRQRWEYWVIAMALCKLGAIITPATIQLTAKDIGYRLKSSGARALVVMDDDYVLSQAEPALSENNQVDVRILVNARGGSVAGNTTCGGGVRCAKATADGGNWLDFNALIAAESGDFQRPQGAAATKNSDIMLIYFTSGTTGLAKMAMQDFTHPLGHIITARYWQQVRENELHCSVTDSGWAKFGWGKIYGQWICGAAIFAYDAVRFEPVQLLARIERYRLKTFCVPPTMYRFMLQEDILSYDLSSVETFTTAGEPLNAEVTRQWQELTGKLIREGFGQSESPVLLATFPWLQPHPGSMGKPSPLFDIQLLGEDGQPVADGDEGLICVCGLRHNYPPGLFVGYYRDQQLTASAVGGDYYNLHDLAWRDVDGYYTFVGRDDDVIKCSGYRIGPFEVESSLIEHPAVLECAVTAAPDEVRGSVVKATIQLKAGFEPSEELVLELQEHVKQSTAPYKYPRIIEFVDALPKTVSGKIKRGKIRVTDAGGTWVD
ncbi:MAG: AMP-binding protein [Actinomycetia bacterium]|nr:AMP-binding protein [Actinomycetes bacterium]